MLPESIQSILKKEKLILLGEYKSYNKKITIKRLECGHEIETLPQSIKRNLKRNGCYKCSVCGAEKKKRPLKEVIEYISKTTQKEYKVISAKNWVSTRDSKLEVFHKTCGKSFEITYSNFKIGRRCPHCAAKTTESKAAQLLKKVLEHINIKFEVEKEFKDLKNPFTNRPLRYDIYLPELKTIIEIDGEQHFVPVDRFGGKSAFIQTKYRDYLKNKYAIKNSLNLLRIPLYDLDKKRRRNYEEVKIEIFNLIEYIVKELKK